MTQVPKRIQLKGDVPTQVEGLLAVAVTPGQLVEQAAAGTWQPHSTASGAAANAFALERGWLGESIDTVIPIGDQLIVGVFESGDEVYAFLASGQNVAIGAFLESDGAGALQAWTTGTTPHSVIARALEAVDASAGLARIRVEVL